MVEQIRSNRKLKEKERKSFLIHSKPSSVFNYYYSADQELREKIMLMLFSLFKIYAV